MLVVGRVNIDHYGVADIDDDCIGLLIHRNYQLNPLVKSVLKSVHNY